MVEERKQIRNSRGERVFDLVRKNHKLYIETYNKGKTRTILLMDEIYKVCEALKPNERAMVLEVLAGMA